jgi:hypothetical protein
MSFRRDSNNLLLTDPRFGHFMTKNKKRILDTSNKKIREYITDFLFVRSFYFPKST